MKRLIELLVQLKWKKLDSYHDLTCLMYCMYTIAKEESTSLYLAIEKYEKDENVKTLSHAELHTNNYKYANYQKTADHHVLLESFLKKAGVLSGTLDLYPGMINPHVFRACRVYETEMNAVSSEARAMAIVAKRRDLGMLLSFMSENLLFGQENVPEHLSAFRYYIEQRLNQGSEHGYRFKDFVVDNPEVEEVYAAQAALYISAFPLAFGDFDAFLKKRAEQRKG